MRLLGTKEVSNLAVASLPVVDLPLGQVVFGPSQWGPIPGGVPLAGFRTRCDPSSHRCEGSRTDGMVKWGAMRVQFRTRSVDVRRRVGLRMSDDGRASSKTTSARP
jgi:hypothetical protein